MWSLVAGRHFGRQLWRSSSLRMGSIHRRCAQPATSVPSRRFTLIAAQETAMTTVHDFSAQTIDGKPLKLADFKGKVLLVVNTASQCGFTPQYKGLETLHKKYSGGGFAVLGFPSNQFGQQEPGPDSEIAQFCEMNYGVTFPMFSKVDVNGANAHPLYKYLTSEKKGLLGSEAIKWNFTKFLIGKDGAVIERYAPTTKPEEIAKDIERALAA
jgi:glutathione peroxidase